MKKRIITVVILTLLFIAAGVVLLYRPAFVAVQDLVRKVGVYQWLKDNFYDFYMAVRYGKRGLFVVVVVALVFVSLFAFKGTNVQKVNDETMQPVSVGQKPYIYSKDGKPVMVVIEEKKEGK